MGWEQMEHGMLTAPGAKVRVKKGAAHMSAETTLQEGWLYWVRVPERGGRTGYEEEWMSDWQPALFHGSRWELLGDNDIYQGDLDFDRIVVHPFPIVQPDV